MSQNPLLDTLTIIDTLRSGDATAADLASLLDVSPATLKRHISEARHLGAVIESVRGAGGWRYVLRNSAKLRHLDSWLRLERARNTAGALLVR